MTAAKHKAIIQESLSEYNAFDVEAMLSSVHHDVKFQNVSGGEVNAEDKGIDELGIMAEHSRQLFSSRHQAMYSAFLREPEGKIL
jgi:hypothetical protein